jgi:hypothetical protein
LNRLSTTEQAVADTCLILARQRFGADVSLVVAPAADGRIEARIVVPLARGPARFDGVQGDEPPVACASGRAEALELLLGILAGNQ